MKSLDLAPDPQHLTNSQKVAKRNLSSLYFPLGFLLMNQKHGQANVDPGLVLSELQLERLDPE